MALRFRLFRRADNFWTHDGKTGKQTSLKTKDRTTALRLLAVQNEAHQQPVLNLQIARTYLSASDPEIAKRTWQLTIEEIIQLKSGANRIRWERAAKDEAFDLIRNVPLLETRSEHLLQVLRKGTVSTNVFLRRLHNFALDMNWLPWPVVAKKHWPKVRFGEKRAITLDEHQRILKAELNPERRAFYELCWNMGGAQSDMASLTAEDIQWDAKVIAYFRKKTGTVSTVRFDEQFAEALRQLPTAGPLFPNFGKLRETHRATEFKRCCRRAGVEGVTLHSYRYSWAERAKVCGYPERFAMENLGHNSKAVHRAYARKAKVTVPALSDYEHKIVSAAFLPEAASPVIKTL